MKARITVIVIVVVLGIILFRAMRGRDLVEEGTRIPCSIVQQGEFVVSITEIGDLSSKESKNISAPIQGKILRAVEEGTYVQPGDELVAFDDEQIKKEVDQAELALKSSNASEEQAREKLRMDLLQRDFDSDNAQTEFEFQKTELEKAEKTLELKIKLFAEDLIPKEEMEEQELEVDKKRFQLEKASNSLKLQEERAKSSFEEQEASLLRYQQDIDRKQAEYDDAFKRLGNTILFAEAEGLVLFGDSDSRRYNYNSGGNEFEMKPGQEVQRNQHLFTIPNLRLMQTVIQVNEKDLNRLEKGQQAVITCEALPDRVFGGEVTRIAKTATRSYRGMGANKFAVTVEMTDSDPDKIRPGMSAKCEVILSRMPGTVFMPVEAVYNKEGRRVCYVVEGEKFFERELELGERNENYVQVIAGVKQGERVALEDPTLVEGKRLIFYDRKEEGLPTPPATQTEEVLPGDEGADEGDKPEKTRLTPEGSAGVENIIRKGMGGQRGEGGRPGEPGGERGQRGQKGKKSAEDEAAAGRPTVEVVLTVDGETKALRMPVSLTMIEKILEKHPGAKLITIDGIDAEEFKKKLTPTDYTTSGGGKNRGGNRVVIYN